MGKNDLEQKIKKTNETPAPHIKPQIKPSVGILC